MQAIAGLDYKQIRREYLKNRRRHIQDISAAIEQGMSEDPEVARGGLKPDDVSLAGLYMAYAGHDEYLRLDPRSKSGYSAGYEAEGVPTFSQDYANVIGQLMYSAIMRRFNMPGNVFSGIIPTVQTPFLNGETIPGFQNLSDRALVVAEGEDYPYVTAGDDYISIPGTVKRGLIAAATREAIFADRINAVMEQCNQVGKMLALNKEKRLIDLVLGVTNNYTWRGTGYNTYQTATPWINSKTSNAMSDFSNFNVLEKMWLDMSDPNTGEPIELGSDTTYLIASHAMAPTYGMIAAMTNINRGVITSTADAVSNRIDYGVAGAVYRGISSYSPLMTPLVDRRMTAASIATTTWYLGQPQNAFGYAKNWDIEVTRAPANSEAGFQRDIIVQVKASERGVAFVKEPRLMIKSAA